MWLAGKKAGLPASPACLLARAWLTFLQVGGWGVGSAPGGGANSEDPLRPPETQGPAAGVQSSSQLPHNYRVAGRTR